MFGGISPPEDSIQVWPFRIPGGRRRVVMRTARQSGLIDMG
jgi:hypothetical protein